MDDTEVLLEQIEHACRRMKMAQSTFGRLAVNDGKLVARLQQGGRVTVQTVERVHRFIEEQGGTTADALLGGTVITETVFSRRGIGRIVVEAVDGRDIPVVLLAVVVSATVFVVINFVVDLLYGVLDPRVRIA